MRRPVFVLLAVAACSSGAGDAELPASTASTASTASAADAGPAVLDVVAPAVGGGQIDLAAYAGRDLALWFWAPT